MNWRMNKAETETETIQQSASQRARLDAYSLAESQSGARSGVRGAAANILYYSGIIAAQRYLRQRRRQVCVLGLHRVLTDEQRSHATSLAAMSIRAETFRRMLAYLQRNYELISLQHLIAEEFPANGKPLCLLTFDDGWEDNYTTAREILQEFGIRPLIFIATGLIGSGATFWEETLLNSMRSDNTSDFLPQLLSELRIPRKSITPEQLVDALKRMPEAERAPILCKFLGKDVAVGGNQMMTWEQLARLKDLGFDFGAHTVNHPLLCYERDQTVLRELSVSKETLEEKLGISIHAFAYPSGNHDQRVEQLVQRSGFRFAFTCEPQWSSVKQDPLAIPRFLLHEGCVTNRGDFSPAALELTLTGWRQ
jgi:peptidoglycan/xylan/chitin deacetylase (PgdA/CDA1 family)